MQRSERRHQLLIENLKRFSARRKLFNGEMGVTSSAFYQSRNALDVGIGEASEARDSPKFRFGVFEKRIVLNDEPRFSFARFDQPSVIDFPKS
jgi:hypothetical protein